MARLLVVDDDQDCIEFLRIHLRRQGHDVVGAADGAAALSVVESVKPDALLVDLRLPGIDGARLVEILRANPLGAALPVVFISAADSRWAASRLPSDARTRFVEKPIDFQRLDLALAELLPEAGRDDVPFRTTEPTEERLRRQR